jgi:D-arabinitol 4-dehydrogenase
MPNILHVGLGAFHRAHQACYQQRLRQIGERDWSLIAGNLRLDAPEIERALIAQQGRYTLETVSPAGTRRYARIDVIDRVIPVAPDAAELLQCAAEPDTRIISFTVTEAGYYLDAQQQLLANHADVAADLQRLRRGAGAVHTLHGLLARALRRRRERDAGPLTLLSCDNLRHNGELTRTGLQQFLVAAGDAGLAEWIGAHCSFPNSMVDRITPRATPELRERVQASTGYDDRAPVMAEEHLQWVIEDRFAAGRPRWEAVGVQLVDSVAPYEAAKIRLLNASHSILAWAGALAGYRHVHEAAADPQVRRLAFDFATDAAIPALTPSPIDLPAYRDTILERFGNAALADTLERIVADSYAKLREFIVPTLLDCASAGRLSPAAAMAPALFVEFVKRCGAGSTSLVYRDAALPVELRGQLLESTEPAEWLCADGRLWGPLRADAGLVAAIQSRLMALRTAAWEPRVSR